MATAYFLIASRDPFESREALSCYELAQGLAEAGHVVTVFLVQNGVLPARPSLASQNLLELIRHKVTVLADEFSLKERGIERLVPGVTAAPIERVIEALASGAKTLWH